MWAELDPENSAADRLILFEVMGMRYPGTEDDRNFSDIDGKFECNEGDDGDGVQNFIAVNDVTQTFSLNENSDHQALL